MTDNEPTRCPDCGLLTQNDVEVTSLGGGNVQITTTRAEHDDYRCQALKLDREWRDTVIRWREDDLWLAATRHQQIVELLVAIRDRGVQP